MGLTKYIQYCAVALNDKSSWQIFMHAFGACKNY